MNITVIWYDDYDNEHTSRVYAIDSVRDRFLVVDDNEFFNWADTKDCKLVKEE